MQQGGARCVAKHPPMSRAAPQTQNYPEISIVPRLKSPAYFKLFVKLLLFLMKTHIQTEHIYTK